MNRAARLIASLAGCGLAPIAPGTIASAVAAFTGAGLLSLGWPALACATLAASAIGWWAVHRCGARNDPAWVVIDEVAGQWCALCALPYPDPWGVLAAFLLFRLLDIAKPGPIGWADRRQTPLGVMLDDLIAGALTALIIVAARAVGPHLLDARGIFCQTVAQMRDLAPS